MRVAGAAQRQNRNVHAPQSESGSTGRSRSGRAGAQKPSWKRRRSAPAAQDGERRRRAHRALVAAVQLRQEGGPLLLGARRHPRRKRGGRQAQLGQGAGLLGRLLGRQSGQRGQVAAVETEHGGVAQVAGARGQGHADVCGGCQRLVGGSRPVQRDHPGCRSSKIEAAVRQSRPRRRGAPLQAHGNILRPLHALPSAPQGQWDRRGGLVGRPHLPLPAASGAGAGAALAADSCRPAPPPPAPGAKNGPCSLLSWHQLHGRGAEHSWAAWNARRASEERRVPKRG